MNFSNIVIVLNLLVYEGIQTLYCKRKFQFKHTQVLIFLLEKKKKKKRRTSKKLLHKLF